MAGACGYSEQPVIIEVQDREEVSGSFNCAPSSTMESSQFLLKWNNHQPTVVSVLDYLLNQEAFVDVTLACEGQSFLAHKVVLSACSTYFQDLLMKNPCKHPIIFLKDVRSRDVASLLQFMYRGEINVQQDDLPLFLKTAESLQIKGLADSSMRSPPLDDGEMDSSPIAPASRRGPPDSSEPTDADSVDQKHQHRAAERFGNGCSTRSLLASALGHLVRNSSAAGPPDASPAPSFPVTTAAAMEYDHAGPSALTIATPPPAGLFSLPVTPSPGAPTCASREDPRCTPEPPEWLSQTSHSHHRHSESPPRSHHENGDSRDYTDHSDKVEPIDIEEILPGLPPETDPSQFYTTSMVDNQRFYECNICRKLFNSRRRDRFLAHLRLHTGERPFKCSICGRGFNRQDHVTVHMRLHTGGKPFQCSKCHHRFAKMVQLKSHVCQTDSASGNGGSSDVGFDLATPQSRPQNSRRYSNKR